MSYSISDFDIIDMECASDALTLDQSGAAESTAGLQHAPEAKDIVKRQTANGDSNLYQYDECQVTQGSCLPSASPLRSNRKNLRSGFCICLCASIGYFARYE